MKASGQNISNEELEQKGQICKRFFAGTEFAETPINQINENTIRRFILETIKRLELCKETCRKFFG